MKKSLFIVFEGIDGCGKTTQIKKFVEFLFEADKHNHILLTREPFADVNTRKILQQDNDPLTHSEQLAKLFISDRKQHVKKMIIPGLKAGSYVICDRYKYSTIAYQSAQGLDMAKLIKLQEKILDPDIVFLVDLPAKKAQVRMRQDTNRKEHKFEANINFLEKVRQNFLKLSKLLKHKKIIVINGDQTREEIFKQIISQFNKYK